MPERIQLSTEWGYHVNTKSQWSWIISEKTTFSMISSFETFKSPKLLFDVSITSSINRTFSKKLRNFKEKKNSSVVKVCFRRTLN